MFMDIAVILVSITSVLVVLWKFTSIVTTPILMFVGGTFGLLVVSLLILGAVKNGVSLGKSSKTTSAFSSSNGGAKSQAEVVSNINDKLEETPEWDTIEADPEYTYAERKKIINKKSREMEVYWAVLSHMTHRKLPVLITYFEDEDAIVRYEPVPPANRREDMFQDFEPVVLERLMSRSWDEEEDEEDSDARFDFNINDKRPEDEEGEGKGGWFG